MDLRRVVTIKYAIDGAVAAARLAGGQWDMDAYIVLSETYGAFLDEVRSALDSDPVLLSELDRQFKPLPHPAHRYGVAQIMEKAERATEAGVLLARLAGWLEGLMVERQMELNAETYAKEQARAMRKTGFAP